MREHAGWLYDVLTRERSVSLSLDELVTRGAEFAPALLPTLERMSQERACFQADKEGWEIDQGIFLWGVLRDPSSGTHLIESMLQPTRGAQEHLPAFQAQGRVDLGLVLIERKGRAAHLTVRNVDGLNAEDDELADAMETAVDLALLDDQVKVGVLRGGVMSHPKYEGRRVFCSGINLRKLHEGRISFVNFLLRRELGYVSKVYRGLRLPRAGRRDAAAVLEKPWVAAVDTFAIGGGLQLLLAFDRVLACSDAYLHLPAAQEGIVPGAANLRLGRLGGRLARDLILRGRRIQVQEAEAAGLVDDVMESSEMDGAIERAVAELDSEAVVANRRMSRLVDEPLDRFREYMAEFSLAQSQRIYSPDVLERLRVRWLTRTEARLAPQPKEA